MGFFIAKILPLLKERGVLTCLGCCFLFILALWITNSIVITYIFFINLPRYCPHYDGLVTKL